MPSTAGTHTDGGAVMRRTGIAEERHYWRPSRSFKKRSSISAPVFTPPAVRLLIFFLFEMFIRFIISFFLARTKNAPDHILKKVIYKQIQINKNRSRTWFKAQPHVVKILLYFIKKCFLLSGGPGRSLIMKSRYNYEFIERNWVNIKSNGSCFH